MRMNSSPAVSVVEVLEVVQVEHDHSQRALLAGGPVQLALERLFQVAPIEQTGEGVTNGQVFQGLPEPKVRQARSNVFG